MNSLPAAQAAFRPFRSVEEPLALLNDEILSARSSGRLTLAVFFDIEKAYDTLCRSRVLVELRRLGFRGFLPMFVRNFLRERFFRVRVGGSLSRSFPQAEGVPQGCVLSVLCFSLVMNTVVSELPSSIHTSLYADDLAVYFSGRDPAVIERQIQLAVNSVARWADSIGFRLSPAKTKAMAFFSGRSFRNPSLSLSLSGSPISFVASARFLGLIFDRGHTWLPHIQHLRTRVQPPLTLLRYLSHRSWGADRFMLHRLYDARVQSILDFGCFVYSSATDARLRRLNSIQSEGLRLISGAFRSTPVVSLQVECNVAPLSLRRSFLACKAYLRWARLPDSQLGSSLLDPSPLRPSFLAQSVEPVFVGAPTPFPLPVSPVSLCSFPPWTLRPITVCRGMFVASKGSTLPSLSRALHAAHLPQHASSVAVYTDGSRGADGCAASAFCPLLPDLSFGSPLLLLSPSFKAEFSAILRLLTPFHALAPASFTIFCDCKGALLSPESLFSAHPLVRRVQALYHILYSLGVSVSFCWVPSHVGIPGN